MSQLVDTEHSSDLWLFPLEPRNLAHRVHLSDLRTIRLVGAMQGVTLGKVVLDADIFAESIDCESLRSMRQCVVNVIVTIEEAE